MWALLFVLSLTHPLVVVDGEETCPAPGEVEDRLSALIPRVDERESQDRAYLQRTGSGLLIDLRRDDGERLAQRVLAANGSCSDLAAATAVVIATWEMHLKPGIVAHVDLPADPSPPATARSAGGGAARSTPLARSNLEARIGVLLSQAGGDLEPGLTIGGSFTPTSRRLGMTIGLSAAAQRLQAVAQSGGGGARWTRGVLALGAQYRFDLPGRLLVDVHGEGLGALVRVEGASPAGTTANPPQTWSSRADFSGQVGLGTGVRAARAWGPAAAWIGVGLLVWPGHQRLQVDGNPAASGELPRIEGEVAVGAAWRRFP